VTSSGVGLAPHVDELSDDLLELLPAAPTLLQRRLNAEMDLRAVAVASQVFVWARPRNLGDAVDWRLVDPAGTEFTRIADPGIADAVRSINDDLGLSFAVHDWVVVGGRLWFLEVNPSGQWLFLAESAKAVGAALAAHLAAAGGIE
jgi:hypothetical protein